MYKEFQILNVINAILIYVTNASSFISNEFLY